MTRPPETIADALEILARIQPAAIALQAPDHRPLSYAELSVHARYVQHRLAGWGIVPGDIATIRSKIRRRNLLP
jgi:non-ribosomal peptide synthetase component E (peptide arylation enzyme)